MTRKTARGQNKGKTSNNLLWHKLAEFSVDPTWSNYVLYSIKISWKAQPRDQIRLFRKRKTIENFFFLFCMYFLRYWMWHWQLNHKYILCRYNVYISMFYKVLQTFLLFLVWYSFFVVAFALGFYIMLHKVVTTDFFWALRRSKITLSLRIVGFPRLFPILFLFKFECMPHCYSFLSYLCSRFVICFSFLGEEKQN